MINNIITGERVQQLCSIYIGNPDDFYNNPIIREQNSKHLNIDNISDNFDNPYLVFCYSYYIEELSKKIHFFNNNFALITHNSDHIIEQNDYVLNILNNNKLDYWFGQNACFIHAKLHLLPIGLANSMWPHGDLSIFDNKSIIANLKEKVNHIYFNFKINTNPNKRLECFLAYKNKIEWLNTIDPVSNLYRLKDYKFCICPEGNGVDTHRLWECLYLKVVPIVINSPFTKILLSYNVPLVVLNTWSELNIDDLIYEDYCFDNETFQKLLNTPLFIKRLSSLH